ncbi:MAG TPA: patatin-like phospholipase family protein [Beijerinckiaceae bacterium]|jgi:NTE family protein
MASSQQPRVAVALGAGGARGLAHILVVEAFEELGLAPCMVAGASMGAIVGAAWAAGLTAREMRDHLQGLMRNRGELMARLLRARVGRIGDMFGGRLGNPVLLDAERFLDLFWPQRVPDRFEELGTPLRVAATDFFGRCERLFDAGPLAPAVGASMAIPGLLRPVAIDQRVYVDGGAVNPLPYRCLMAEADVVVACDVVGGPSLDGRATPSPFDAMFGAAQIMQGAITAEMLRASRPHVLVRPQVERFRVLDFFQAQHILAAAAPVKDEVKRGVEAALAARLAG